MPEDGGTGPDPTHRSPSEVPSASGSRTASERTPSQAARSSGRSSRTAGRSTLVTSYAWRWRREEPPPAGGAPAGGRLRSVGKTVAGGGAWAVRRSSPSTCPGGADVRPMPTSREDAPHRGHHCRVPTTFALKYTLRASHLELGGVDLDLAVEDDVLPLDRADMTQQVGVEREVRGGGNP